MPDGDRKKVDAKNEDEGEKIWKNVIDFWILHIKIRLCGNFHENCRKNFLTHFLGKFLPEKDLLRQRCWKGSSKLFINPANNLMKRRQAICFSVSTNIAICLKFFFLLWMFSVAWEQMAHLPKLKQEPKSKIE